jgi:hypothetical protein
MNWSIMLILWEFDAARQRDISETFSWTERKGGPACIMFAFCACSPDMKLNLSTTREL